MSRSELPGGPPLSSHPSVKEPTIMAEYAHPEVLVSIDWLKQNLDKPGVRIVEVDVDPKLYVAGHIPGAVGFDWTTQLQDQVNRDIISKEAFEALLGKAGIKNPDTVII